MLELKVCTTLYTGHFEQRPGYGGVEDTCSGEEIVKELKRCHHQWVISKLQPAEKDQGVFRGSQYLTEMEKSPGELWLALMMKNPISLPISKFSA